MAAPQVQPQSSGYFQPHRSSTLNRLDLLKRRQQQHPSTSNATTLTLRRNLSSLGHYPSGSSGARAPDTPARNGYDPSLVRLTQTAADGRIYAPASVAHQRNSTNYSIINWPKQRASQARSSDEQHYASTSLKGFRQHDFNPPQQQVATDIPAPKQQPTARPESALGQLLERFGTFRRKARRHFSGRSWSSTRRSQTPSQIYAPASIAGYPLAGNAASVSSQSPSTGSSKLAGHIPPLSPSQPLVLDPAIYASGRRQVEADEIYAEGSRAIDSNAERRLLEHELDAGLMFDGETRVLIDHPSQQQLCFRLLVRRLTGWLNDELAQERIVVRSLQEDLHDGQVLCKLVERLQNIKLDVVEVTQNEQTQRRKLKIVIETLNRLLISRNARHSWSRVSWSVEGIHCKNMVEILKLLVAMALLYRAPVRLPANVFVNVLTFQKHNEQLVLRRSHQVQLTDESAADAAEQVTKTFPAATSASAAMDASSARRDAFDMLLECAPEKLHIVKQSLSRFCNRHLNKINMSCGPVDDLKPENFSDGLLLVFLISSLEDYFVPLGNLLTTTLSTSKRMVGQQARDEVPFIDANNNLPDVELETYAIGIGRPTALEPSSYICSQPIEKLHNVNVALQLMQDAGLVDIRQRVRPEEIVNGDLKAVLRVLYAIFGRYKHL